MKKFSKIAITCLVIAVVITMLVGSTTANPTKSLGTYDPAIDGIVSQYYHIDREKKFITGIAPGTTAEDLLKVCLPGNAVVSQQVLGTGATISTGVPYKGEVVMPAEVEDTTDAQDTTTDSAAEETTQPETTVPDTNAESTELDDTYTLTVIVTGDVNGNGEITATDMMRIKAYILGEQLNDAELAAGDVNYSGDVTVTDFLRIKGYLLGLNGISAGNPELIEKDDPFFLMTPNTTTPWGIDVTTQPLTFISYNPAIATVDAEGVIHALELEGSTMIYALNEAEEIVAEAMVTVLAEGLRVSLSDTELRLQINQTKQLYATINHPVRPVITWSSSDSTIVSVDADGNLTANGIGSAVITASLENGSSAEVTVHVAPPITALDIDRQLYKVKPGKTKTLQLFATPAESGEEIIWTTADASIATVDSNGVVTGVAYGTTTITATGKYSGLTATCKIKVCNVKQVAITFDDGPSNQTAKLLDFLKENDIRVTFFLVGDRISSYSNTIKREVAEGHEIGYHSYSHQMQTSLSSSQITSDFEKANKQLKNLTGKGFTVWRTPGGEYNSRVLSAVPLPHIMWSVDTLDWQSRNATAVYNKIINNAKDGSIILMHDLYASTVTGAINAMRDMLAGDYEFVTVTELLSRNGNKPANCKTYFSGPTA